MTSFGGHLVKWLPNWTLRMISGGPTSNSGKGNSSSILVKTLFARRTAIFCLKKDHMAAILENDRHIGISDG